MDSFIFKGKSSEEFKIIVNSLPSISKPTLRVEEIEIDGVDGTRYEDLGYGSYDKKIKITITEDNIDSLIGWLKGEGDLILSNEPDKYYKAKIIDQVNFSRLMKYEPTEITFRVQPFKYEYQEEEQTIATGSIEGTEIKINDVKAIEIKLDGRSIQDGTPTPDSPVEIESVGYENLFDISKFPFFEKTAYNSTGAEKYWDDYCATKEYIPVEQNTTYTYSNNVNHESLTVVFYDVDKNVLSVFGFQTKKTFTTPENCKYIRISLQSSVIPTEVQLEKGNQEHSYIPYDKYGIEVETVGKNLLNTNALTTRTTDGIKITNNGDGSFTINGISSAGDLIFNVKLDKAIQLKKGKTYTLCNNANNSLGGAIILRSDENTTVLSCQFNQEYVNYTPTSDVTINYLRFWGAMGITYTDFIIKPQLEEGSTATEFEKYKSNKSVLELDAPLRSLPNGVKDIAYIRNNKLYVDRYVTIMILNGSENWAKSTRTDVNRYYVNGILNTTSNRTDIKSICSHFKSISQNQSDEAKLGITTMNTDGIMVNIDVNDVNFDTLDEFKTKLSNYPMQFDYELATPVTEELRDTTIIELVDGENNISNSADTNMIVDYVDNKLIINNLGNYVSKPIFEIEGVGTIKFILNGYSVFTYNFDEDGRVVIDSEKEDAYLGSVLKNRNMNGEFPKLEIGENIVTWDGLVKNIKAVKKSRWL